MSHYEIKKTCFISNLNLSFTSQFFVNSLFIPEQISLGHIFFGPKSVGIYIFSLIIFWGNFFWTTSNLGGELSDILDNPYRDLDYLGLISQKPNLVIVFYTLF